MTPEEEKAAEIDRMLKAERRHSLSPGLPLGTAVSLTVHTIFCFVE
jgi:hypothetical protein